MIVFCLFLVLVIYPLGKLIVSVICRKQSFWSDILLSLVLGLVALTIESYTFQLPLVFFAAQTTAAWILFFVFKLFPSPPTLSTLNPAVVSVILLSTYVSGLLVFPFGQIHTNHISLPAAHAIDSTWHLSLINSLIRNTRPINPLFSGEKLSNYHYFVDLQIATISRLTALSPVQLFFTLIGPLYFLLFAASAYMLVVAISKSQIAGLFAVLLATLTSNLYYLVKYVYPLSFPDPSLAWVDFFSTKSVNYPLTFSLIVLNVVIYLLFFAKKSTTSALVIGLLIASLVGFKIYAAVLLLFGLAVLSIVKLLRHETFFTKTLLVAVVSGYFLLGETFKSDPGSLIFYPFWFIKTMYESPFHLNHPDWELRRQFFLSVHRLPGLIRLYLSGFLVFMLINFGPLLLGLSQIFKKINLLFTLIFVSGIVFSMSFIYKHNAVVTIEFVYYSLVTCAYLTAILISRIAGRFRFTGLLFGIIIFVVTLPGVNYHTGYFLDRLNGSDVSPTTVQAVQFLYTQPFGTVLLSSSLRNGSFIPAYSQKDLYLGDKIITDGLNLDSAPRVNRTEEILTCTNQNYTGLSYLMVQGQNSCLKNNTALIKIFQEDDISIYKVI